MFNLFQQQNTFKTLKNLLNNLINLEKKKIQTTKSNGEKILHHRPLTSFLGYLKVYNNHYKTLFT